MKDVYILAIESSCDETSVSIIKNGYEDVSTIINSQIDVHTKYGGVVPEVASRLHLENITMVIDQCLENANMKLEDIDAFACTYAPGLLGSLLVGVEATKALSFVYNKPFIAVNHMMGHIYANMIGNKLEYPLISLIVSGGHTDLILMKSENEFEYLGQTLDDAIGEAYDKVARILNLPYPGGPNVEKFAKEGTPSYKMPQILNDDSFNFSFSGIKSHINNLVHNENQRGNKIRINDMCTAFQNRVVTIITKKTEKAISEYGVKNFVVAGGVAANSALRESLNKMAKEKKINISFPDLKYCTDNAAMIGAAAYYAYKNGIRSDLTLNAKATDSLYEK